MILGVKVRSGGQGALKDEVGPIWAMEGCGGKFPSSKLGNDCPGFLQLGANSCFCLTWFTRKTSQSPWCLFIQYKNLEPILFFLKTMDFSKEWVSLGYITKKFKTTLQINTKSWPTIRLLLLVVLSSGGRK